ncbi:MULTISPECIES: tryptophan--tRNA ligase [Fervidobacterium]|uniref:Tryptophan--tRNA ligase n=1 Tax=Fervidobacterium nodosum (strain ATCC 35602 / DSM 5306 / Rt17-B1) TaxID=381764 RepID=A7HLF6_FERNB|nr:MULTISPECIES: tryptophan--tRNA ligase [Fervidobacterium]ABS60739.1 tryptophanyl-tRNA synthetase [Fervidobacterium nodosum Rt17-B1]KAF2960899.1 tryptophan--tRNA ligase [Fervidobacterium sp. 2310opik-2]PHJ14197.1 tryptophan--tRNA ligase [Fervidobacterium sp. SC_NGM5_G05]
MRILSGIRPTGKVHVGHYVGVFENWIKLQNEGHDTFYFIADWHALTTHYEDTSELKHYTKDLARTLIAVGLDKSTLFVQSAVKEHAELMLIFSMVTPLSWLERVPTYKEMKQQLANKDLSNAGFLMYPVLQAADILIYKADGVPVGEDQVYHIELTREIARRFNYIFKKEIFPEPKELLSKVPKLLGTDGRKMSKSYGNTIPLITTENELSKMVLPMVTDPARKRRTDPGNPENCPVWDYHKAFGTADNEEEKQWVFEGCTQAKIGCVDCKKLLLKHMTEKLSPIWERYNSITEGQVQEIIENGNEKAREIAKQTMEEVRDAVKIMY